MLQLPSCSGLAPVILGSQHWLEASPASFSLEDHRAPLSVHSATTQGLWCSQAHTDLPMQSSMKPHKIIIYLSI